jgi:transcriptional regulator with XRE-family HTH domain
MHPLLETDTSVFGSFLREWRRRRKMSQMELSLNAGISTRHLSFLETGRSNPSEATVEALIATLEVPPHEASMFRHLAGWGGRSREAVNVPLPKETLNALTLLLSGQDPEAAIALDHVCNIIMVNKAYARFIGRQFGGDLAKIAPLAPIAQGRLNLLHMILAPDRYRRIISNWREVASAVLHRVRQSLFIASCAAEMRDLLRDLMKYPDVGRLWNAIDPDLTPPLVVEVHMQLREHTVCITSTIATLGGPSEAGLSGIYIETFHAVRQ